MIRSVLIARGIAKAGRKGQNIDLTQEFNELLRDITKDYPCWIPLPKLGSFAATQDKMDMPGDFRSRDYFIIPGYPHLAWREPLQYFRYVRSLNSDSSGRPLIYTVQKNHKKIYLYPPADQIYTYELSYAAIHPRASKTLNFTSGGGTNKEIKVGDTVTGETSGATAVVEYVYLSSGKWADADAAGTLIFTTTTGTFQAETLKIGAVLDVATISGSAVTEDNFQNFLGDDFDDVLILGLAWKASELISDLRERAPYWEGTYLSKRQEVYDSFKQTTILIRSNVFAPAWKRRVK